MNKTEYMKQMELIKNTYGVPEFSVQGNPANECAAKLTELRNSYEQGRVIDKQNKKLTDKLNIGSRTAVPENVVRGEWLITFNDTQRKIVSQWFKNTQQTPKEIADAVETTVAAVKQVMGLEAFKILHKHLTEGMLEILPLEAAIHLREVMNDPNVTTKLKAALSVLINAGHMKATQADVEIHNNEIVLDAETAEKLRILGDKAI